MNSAGYTPISSRSSPIQNSLIHNIIQKTITTTQQKESRNKRQRLQSKISKTIQQTHSKAQKQNVSPQEESRYHTRSIAKLTHQPIEQNITKAPDRMPQRSITINRRCSNASNASNSSGRRESTAAWTTQENVEVTGFCGAGATNCQWINLSRYETMWKCGRCLAGFHSRCFFAHQNIIRGRGRYVLDCPNCAGEEGAFYRSWGR